MSTPLSLRGSQLHPDPQPYTLSITAKLPLETLPHCPLDLIALSRQDSVLFFVVRINSASHFQGRLPVTNSEALSFNQKKARQRGRQ